MLKNNVSIVWIVIALFGLGLIGCATEEAVVQLSAEKRFELAMKKFNDEDYLSAIDDFRIVTLQYQGSAYADDAQYLLGECYFRREQFILAAYEYDVLLRTMPTSEFAPKARYKRAMCYYNLSPTANLDQEYSRKAIDEFQAFVEYYPTDSLASSAEEKIQELNTKLAKKEYQNGLTYMDMQFYKSAIVYFDLVLEKYHDTPYAEQALYKKAEALLYRRRYDEAKTEIEKFLSKYPNSKLKSDAERLRDDAASKLSGKGEGGKGAIKKLNAAQASDKSN